MLMGNLTRKPVLRRTPKGTSVTDVGLAINRYFSQDDGQRREETTFVDVTLWGRQAEIVCDYCDKGRPLYVEGRLNLDSWEDKTSGEQRTKLKVVGENIQLLGSRDGGSSGGSSSQSESSHEEQSHVEPSPQQAQSPPPQADPPSGAKGAAQEEEDDIPF